MERLALPPEVEEALERYAALVRLWAARTDLVAQADLPRFEERHIADSLKLLDLARALPRGPGVDVGSGAGLPGIPLAIAGPRRHWRLLEPRRRRAAFLEEVVRELDLDCEVLPVTAEAAAADPGLRAAHFLAVARAVATPKTTFRMLMPLVARGGVAAVLVGRDAELPAEAEVTEEGVATIGITG